MPGAPERTFRWPPAPLQDGPVVVDLETGPGAIEDSRMRSRRGGDTGSTSRREHLGFWASLESALLGGGGGVDLNGWEPDPVDRICPRCGGPTGPGEVDRSGCAGCRGKRLAWTHTVRLGVYDGDLRRAIMACKYHRDRGVGRVLGRLLAERVADRFRDSGIGVGEVMVVPVPTTTRRRLMNGGLDHTMILAEGVSRVLGTRPVRLLERRHTPHQAGLSAAARARNVAGTIRVRGGRRPPRADHVVLVDDVRTTGATASACFRAIRSGMGERGVGDPPCFWLAVAAVSTRRRDVAGSCGRRSVSVAEN